MLRGFLASPARVFTCSPHVRAFTLSEASVPLLPRSCVCWSLLLWSCSSLPRSPSYSFTLHQPVLDLVLFPETLVPVARSHSFAPLRACAGCSKHVSSAASSRCSRISPSRGLVEGLVFFRALSVGSCTRLLRSFSTWFRRVSDVDVAVASLRLLQASPFLSRRPHRESVLRTSLAHLTVGVSRARHRLSVTFGMYGSCYCYDIVFSSPSMADSTLNSAQFVCHSRCHHSSCLFVNCLLEQLDSVGVSAPPRVNVLHWQRS